MALVCKFASLLLACAFAWGQADSRPRFEVASVKLSDPNSRAPRRWDFPPGEAVLPHIRIKDAVPLAYGLQPFLVSGGPAWFSSNFYDIVGKLAAREGAPPSKKEVLEALQVLLEDRFQLRIHRESKNLALYKLTIAKTGFKLEDGDKLPEGTPPGFEGRFASRIVPNRAPIADLAAVLSAYLDAPVEDHTDLQGVYSFVLEWQHGESGTDSDSAMAAALRARIGLNLEPGKGPVQVLVIDSAERPEAN